MSDGQLALFIEPAEPSERRLDRDELGIRHDLRGGAERLLVALLRNGLGEEHLPSAARLCIALDEGRDV